ncbi:MAG TPA: LuxR C-terminal-related transcriptional regulator [Actinophytocola sp.]|uniref:helix-turn-helix transcriptional regulator n=1 Tax=Actinophytocola sp. TaxID=1872138 RepID=UPI002DBB096C|nr:LuxR C-terminal-related transcriptional regulator [Actinophytocola sp.]HEU5476142.1 LuxR C-terminal-related transcriptional regulator [Actinophytocola sp.]
MRQGQETLTLGKHVPSLQRWGQSPDADLVYRTLITLGPRTVGALARDLGLSHHRVTSALEELVAISAAQAGRAAGRRALVWTPVAPAELAVAVRCRRTVDDADQRNGRRHALTEGLIAEARTIGDGLRHLQTRELARARLTELTDVIRHEHLAMNTEVVFDAESARAGVSHDRKLLRRGVDLRVLGLHVAAPDPMLAFGRQPTEPSPAYRVVPTVPMKLLVIDRKIALFPVAPNDFERGYLEVSQPPLVAALVALFERHWANGTDPEERTVPEMFGPRERALITLLAQGHTDATAARELRISARSVSNIVRALMDRLEVDNRFQLGLVLGALRVASPPGQTGTTSPGHPDETV